LVLGVATGGAGYVFERPVVEKEVNVKPRPNVAAAPVATAPQPISLALRRYLYLTAALTGAAVMIVEILGAKMLSPYVGMSHFVWTAQIAVTLVALAVGYYFGGRMADRAQELTRLYFAILAAAAWLGVTVLICKPVAYWALDFSLPVGSLLASAILFFPPLALLAMTAPFLIRVITSTVAGVGGNVGRLTSVSTLGSFIGTLLIGYVMVPFLPNSMTMCFTALTLLLVCACYFGFFRRPATGPLTVTLALMVMTGLLLRVGVNPHYRNMIELFHGNSHFGQLQVLDDEGADRRFYLNDLLTQNTYDPVRKQSISHFTYMLSGLARAYSTNINDVLCIGLGVGIVPMDFARSGANVDVAEINPAVVPVGVRFFNLEPSKLHITIDDGRHYLNRCSKKYDAVILDAFLGDSSPSHLLSKEAFASVQKILRPGGVLVINLFGDLETGHDFLAASLNKTLKSVFAQVRIHSKGSGNMFFVASDRGSMEFVHPPKLDGLHPAVLEDAQEAYASIVDTVPEDGQVLTDDYNPLEFYDARNREEVRRNLAAAARSREM
jgi:spermidine synthase